MKLKNILPLVILVLFTSCGKKSSSSGAPDKGGQEEVEQNSVEASPGSYYTVLRPINFRANGFIPYGAATFRVTSAELQVNLSLDDDQAVTHRQALHAGGRCPTKADDLNGDGYVDYNEALNVVGQVVVPLDGDLNSQLGGSGIYPRGPAMTYAKTGILSSIHTDLWKSGTVSQGTSVGIEGRVVMVSGTSYQEKFPQSLSTYNGEPAHLSLPIVCGVLQRIE